MSKKIRINLLFLACFFLFPFFSFDSFGSADASSVFGESKRVIVKFKPFTPKIFKEKIIKSNNGYRISEMRQSEFVTASVSDDVFQERLIKLEESWFVEYAEEDYIAKTFEVPNDPKFQDQWGLEKIEMSGAWDVTHGSGEVDIAVIDTGIDLNHEDLVGKVYASVNCISDPACMEYESDDVYGHGTHIAGIVSAVTNNAVGVSGVSWDSRILSVKSLDDNGSGYYSWIANGVTWAADNGAEVINLSLGGKFPSYTLEDAVNYAWDKGVIVVAAAGNSGGSRPNYPANYSNVISVASTNELDEKADFSNWGYWVDVTAPGTSIISTYKGDYEYISGTSMSTAFVSGLAALLAGQDNLYSNSYIRDRIESTADTVLGTGYYWKYGRINACKAVGCDEVVTPTPASQPMPTPTFTPTPTLIPTSTPTPTPTLAPTSTPTPTLSSTPTPTPTEDPPPWWCKYIPWHRLCR